MKIRFSRFIPEGEKLCFQLSNVAQAIVCFGVWIMVFCIITFNAGHSFADSYYQACILAFGFNLAASQLSYPHKAGGDNPALESNENMQDRHTRFIHNAMMWGSIYAFYMLAGWCAAWLFANYLAGVWGI